MPPAGTATLSLYPTAQGGFNLTNNPATPNPLILLLQPWLQSTSAQFQVTSVAIQLPNPLPAPCQQADLSTSPQPPAAPIIGCAYQATLVVGLQAASTASAAMKVKIPPQLSLPMTVVTQSTNTTIDSCRIHSTTLADQQGGATSYPPSCPSNSTFWPGCVGSFAQACSVLTPVVTANDPNGLLSCQSSACPGGDVTSYGPNGLPNCATRVSLSTCTANGQIFMGMYLDGSNFCLPTTTCGNGIQSLALGGKSVVTTCK